MVLAGRHFGTVVDVGGRDINGTANALFTADQRTSLDLHEGPNVDVVTDALDWTPPAPVDLVICMEVLEHEPRQRELVDHMVGWLAPGGQILITAGGPGRAPHSAIDGGFVRDGEPYKNLNPKELADWFAAAGLHPFQVNYESGPRDTYGFGTRPVEALTTAVAWVDLTPGVEVPTDDSVVV
jgi:SAM-dependent methyltransferase